MLIFWVCDWIGKLTGTIVLTPTTYAVGNCAEEIYFGLLKARREQKKLVIIYPFELPTKRLKFGLPNMELVDIESEYRCSLNPVFHFAARLLITVYFGFFRVISIPLRIVTGLHLAMVYRTPAIGALTLWKPEEWMANLSWDVVDKYGWREQLQEPLQVSLRKQKKIIAEKARVKMGVPLDAWFVCLHVRESGFHKDQCDERNANIFNYIEAIKEITGRGGWVVRMGDATMTRLPPMERVIDYPFTEFKSALMDIYLVSECKVYIGMSSGIFDVALLFQRPVITTNMSSWLYPFPQKKCDIGLFKHVYSKSRKRFLSIQEWLAEPLEAVSFLKLGDDYVLHENSSQELKLAVMEFLECGGNFEITPLQRQFNELRIQNGRKIISEAFISHSIYATDQRYRLASRLNSVAGVLSGGYLQANWEHDSRNAP